MVEQTSTRLGCRAVYGTVVANQRYYYQTTRRSKADWSATTIASRDPLHTSVVLLEILKFGGGSTNKALDLARRLLFGQLQLIIDRAARI